MAADEVIHGGVDAESGADDVVPVGRQDAHHAGGVLHELGDEEFGLATLDGIQDLHGHLVLVEDGEEQRHLRLGALEHAGVHVERVDGEGLDVGAFLAELVAEGFQHAADAPLGGAVVGHLGGADGAGGGGDDGDVAVVAGLHLAEEGAGDAEDAAEVDVEAAVDLFVGEVEEALAGDDAGALDENVDLAEVLEGLFGLGVDVLYIGDVDLVAAGFHAESLEGLNGFVDAGDVPNDDCVSAALGAFFGHDEAHAAGATGDEDVLSGDLGALVEGEDVAEFLEEGGDHCRTVP